MTPPLLSLILCSRYDRYMGNSLWRLETTLNYLSARLEAVGRIEQVEVLVTDWGSETPLREAVSLRPAAARLVSFITVPPMLARALQRDSPFPEVLALNTAARRARGRYIGRIDQDTLVGGRFLRWFFDLAEGGGSFGHPGVAPQTALFFANRRDVPYRFVARSPSLEAVTRFVKLFGGTRPIWRENSATGDVFWTGSVGIWLIHRDLWSDCGGYDERLIYYNWMETDMICRLRQSHPIVDLGELTGCDFYHLEHYHPRIAWFDRGHDAKNATISLAAPPACLRPNAEGWGLRDHVLTPESSPTATAVGQLPPADGVAGLAVFAWLMLRLMAGTASDRVFIRWTVLKGVWRRRLDRVRQDLADRPVVGWPGRLWSLWTGRPAARIRRLAGLRTRWLRRTLAATLGRSGLLPWARRLRLRLRLATSSEIRRREREVGERFARFRREYGAVVAPKLDGVHRSPRTALVVSSRCPTIEGELCTIKALQLAGFRPVVLLEDEQRALGPYYELAGVDEIHVWSEFLTSHDHASQAAAMVARCRSTEELSKCTHAGVRVGMIALCTALRRLRLGEIDFRTPGVRELLARCVAASVSAVVESQRILQAVGPDLVLTDIEYTPKGELFETCLANGLDVVACDTAHKSHALMFKRYRPENRDDHLTTLSACSWAFVRGLEWTAARREELAAEVATGYQAGTWFDTPWMQSRARPMDPAALGSFLGLDKAKKTAFIFPHMLWDAPVMWGRPLFPTYQEWLVETVAAACRNTQVNWVVKIHPAHVWKQADERYGGDSAEARVLRDELGALPSHVKLVPPDTPVSTWSLFPVMDYCLTVRGTVGVEAASLGIPVLTAGPARYSGRGFTVDSSSRAEYLARLARIQETPPLTGRQRELAERFAYGLFLLRPLPLDRIRSDPGTLANWFVSRDEDYLSPLS